jgi:hypothetical protein
MPSNIFHAVGKHSTRREKCADIASFKALPTPWKKITLDALSTIH